MTDTTLTPRQQMLADRISFRTNIESFSSSPSIVRQIKNEILADAKIAGVKVEITNVDGYFLSVKPVADAPAHLHVQHVPAWSLVTPAPTPWWDERQS